MKWTIFLSLIIVLLASSTAPYDTCLNIKLESVELFDLDSSATKEKGPLSKTKSYSIEADANQVKEIFADLVQFGEYHPLIKKVVEISSNDMETLYTINEKPFSWLPFKVNYKAKVTVSDNHIKYYLFEMPGNTVEMNYFILEDPDGKTKIDLTIEIFGRDLGKKMLLRKMFEAQDQIMLDIENVN